MAGRDFHTGAAVYGLGEAAGAVGGGPVLNVGPGRVRRVRVGLGVVGEGVNVDVVCVEVGMVVVVGAGAWVVGGGGGGGGGSLLSPTPSLGGKSTTGAPARASFMKAVQISVG